MTCGAGHNAIAKNLKNELEKNNEVEIFDVFGINPKKSLSSHKGYIWSMKHIPHLYGFFWNRLRNKNPEKRYSRVNLSPIKSVMQYNLDKINEFKPDAIICTHNYASNVCSILKKEGKINCTVYTVFHDYVACPFWETSINCDYIFTPGEICDEEVLKRGFKKEQILPFGFPIDKKFQVILDKNEIREKLGIGKNDFVLLSMAGGFGQANSLKVVKEIRKIKYDNFKIIVVCGKNQQQKDKIDKYVKKHNLKNVICYGFVNNVDELMSASDAILTRGGNTINEALLKNLIPIIREGVVANELLNKKLFIKNNVGLGINRLKDLTPLICDMIENPQKIEDMKKNISTFIKRDAVKNMAEFIEKNNAK